MEYSSPDLDNMDAPLDHPLVQLLGKSTITKADVARLRGSHLALGLKTIAEAEMMFAIDRTRGEKCREWGDLLVESMTDFVIWGERPTGVVTEERALWLSDQVGEVPSPASMALLIGIIEEAHQLPAWFQPSVRLRASKAFGRHDLRTMPQAA